MAETLCCIPLGLLGLAAFWFTFRGLGRLMVVGEELWNRHDEES